MGTLKKYKEEANPDYTSLNYVSNFKEGHYVEYSQDVHPKIYKDRKRYPMSVLLRHRLDRDHEIARPWLDINNPERTHVVSTTGKNKTYKPSRIPVLYLGMHVLYKPEQLKADDIQCIVGAKVIQLSDNKYAGNGWRAPSKYEYLQSHTNVESFMTSHAINRSRNVLSVVYISRKDGLINHDIYYRWCKETKLPFPEQLKHTSLDNDCSNTYKVLNLSIKNKHNALSCIDSIRNKKVYTWQIPFDDKSKTATKIFTRPSKSRYDRYWQIDTYKKRRLRRLRREENKHK